MNIKQQKIYRENVSLEKPMGVSLANIAVTNATTRGRCVHTLTEESLHRYINLPPCCHQVLNHVVSLVFCSKVCSIFINKSFFYNLTNIVLRYWLLV